MTVISPPPLVDPDQPLAYGWRIRLPYPMARRIDGESLVFWHSPRRLTFWISASIHKESGARSVADMKPDFPPDARDMIVHHTADLMRTSYRMPEPSDDERVDSFLGRIANADTEIIMAAYFDDEKTIGDVMQAWNSVVGPSPHR